MQKYFEMERKIKALIKQGYKKEEAIRITKEKTLKNKQTSLTE
jgi:hypothetical protein